MEAHYHYSNRRQIWPYGSAPAHKPRPTGEYRRSHQEVNKSTQQLPRKGYQSHPTQTLSSFPTPAESVHQVNEAQKIQILVRPNKVKPKETTNEGSKGTFLLWSMLDFPASQLLGGAIGNPNVTI